VRTVDGVAGGAGVTVGAGVTAGVGVPAGVGVADGLFAAVLAARCPGTDPVVVAPGGTPAFLAPWPLTTLGRPELADLLDRLGIHTLGRFAALPDRHVLARFGVDGVACHRVAQGVEGELPGFRLTPRRGVPLKEERVGGTPSRQPEFWGGEAGATARAARALARVEQLLGPEAVVIGRLQGGGGRPSEPGSSLGPVVGEPTRGPSGEDVGGGGGRETPGDRRGRGRSPHRHR